MSGGPARTFLRPAGPHADRGVPEIRDSLATSGVILTRSSQDTPETTA